MSYDSIIVMARGKIVEHDTPAKLLSNPDGYLRKLVDESGEVETLERMAANGNSGRDE